MNRRGERPFLSLSPVLLGGFLLAFLLQLVVHHTRPSVYAVEYQPLSSPADIETYVALSMGSEQLLGYLLAVYLQLHDSQAGKHLDYELIDYPVLIEWLDRITDLSPGTEYPMLLASRIYTASSNPEQLRQILAFIERRFDDDPQKHWRRLAEASVVAKHRLGDLELALSMARKLAAQPASVDMPRWARDFEFLLLAELNELETAIAIIEALLQTDSISDPDELRFLQSKLSEFQQKLFESRQTEGN